MRRSDGHARAARTAENRAANRTRDNVPGPCVESAHRHALVVSDPPVAALSGLPVPPHGDHGSDASHEHAVVPGLRGALGGAHILSQHRLPAVSIRRRRDRGGHSHDPALSMPAVRDGVHHHPAGARSAFVTSRPPRVSDARSKSTHESSRCDAGSRHRAGPKRIHLCHQLEYDTAP
jgi:hypothetical protein